MREAGFIWVGRIHSIRTTGDSSVNFFRDRLCILDVEG